MARYIDADALKNDILKSAVMIDDRGIQTGYEIAIELIKRQPTIDAEPVRHGRWIPKTIIIGGREHAYGMKCSVCGEDALNAEGDEFLTDYCPNCGCRMDAE